MRILIAIDGSECSDEAIATVARLPWTESLEVKILTVVELNPTLMPSSLGLYPDIYEEWQSIRLQSAKLTSERGVARLKEVSHNHPIITSEIRDGYARDEILAAAEEWGAELIVVGSHGYHGIRRVLLGSVSLFVASHAKCPVLIARCGHAKAE